MADNIDVSTYSKQQLEFLYNELKPHEPKIREKTQYVINKTKHLPDPLSEGEALEYIITNDPILWAKVYLNWDARDYQCEILRQGRRSRQLVLRLGRRLGKTECMCILILWHAYTQHNKDPKNPNVYDILICTPFETQIDLIFKRLHEIIELSPIFKNDVGRDVYHKIQLKNGSSIYGLTAGANSSTGGNNTRGQHANVLIFDEADYIGSTQLTNIINIRNDNPEKVKVIAASTPSGKREEYYKWCIGASRHYKPSQEDIDNYKFSGYIFEEVSKGNGWTEIFAPSLVNKKILEINPDTQQSYLQDIKDELTEIRFEQEVMAGFGEDEMGVYQKKYLDAAITEGERIGHKYTTEMSAEEYKAFIEKPHMSPRILGVDWDASDAAGPSLVCIELDKLHTDQAGNIVPKFKVLFRMELPVNRFTYTDAVDKIIDLNDEYKFDWIAVDKGYGQTQVELLRKYGMANPITGLHKKVMEYQFSQKIEVRDPYTMQKDKKPLKPFMVNNSVVMFERQKIVFNPKDKKMIEQFEGYRIKSYSAAGMPIYSSENEHIIDAFNLALLAFEQNYGDLFRSLLVQRVFIIQGLSPEERIKNEEMKAQANTAITPLIKGYKGQNNKGSFDTYLYNKSKRTSPLMKRITPVGRSKF